jgi:hypothetical protein
MTHDDKTEPYTLRVRAYLDAEVCMVKLRPDNPEYGLWEEHMEDLWYPMTSPEREQLRQHPLPGGCAEVSNG